MPGIYVSSISRASLEETYMWKASNGECHHWQLVCTGE